MNCDGQDDPNCKDKIKKYIEEMKQRDDIKIHVEDYPEDNVNKRHSEL